MLAVQNFAQAQNPHQAILCRCKISRSQLRSVEFLVVQMGVQNLRRVVGVLGAKDAVSSTDGASL
ncbi:hypothetical protein CAMGR0001_2239 [Campylobacter gracilis RM3268]|uniref:Uncharacterized protein n=1 Tax=Campylobacter gracilis RM3268 TaxID=553220 RepID=C8PH51_9BACT|nr:hypothetical protein CAMGR0001_2239 [Campylobacter gracilis RM3268]